MSSRWYMYVLRVQVAHRLTAAETAVRAGMHASVLTMWKKGTAPSARMAIQFARALDENVLVALVEAGFITAEEAGIRTVVRFEDRLINLSTSQLLGELGRRAGV